MFSVYRITLIYTTHVQPRTNVVNNTNSYLCPHVICVPMLSVYVYCCMIAQCPYVLLINTDKNSTYKLTIHSIFGWKQECSILLSLFNTSKNRFASTPYIALNTLYIDLIKTFNHLHVTFILFYKKHMLQTLWYLSNFYHNYNILVPSTIYLSLYILFISHKLLWIKYWKSFWS